METTERRLDELIPYLNNSRKHSDEQIAKICSSIREYGFTTPIIIDEENNILAGHGRLEAVKRLGWDKVPCVVLRGLTKAQKKAYVIADNKLALDADWDFATLKLELENLKELDFDLNLTGFDEFELDGILNDDRSLMEPSSPTYDGEEGGEDEEPTPTPTLSEARKTTHVCPNCGCEFED